MQEELKRIDTDYIFCSVLGNRSVNSLNNFRDFIEECKDFAKRKNNNVKTGALNNVSGAWYQYLISIGIWEFNLNNPGNKELNINVLPNQSSLSIEEFYIPEIRDVILQLRLRAKRNGATLSTSNPDYIFLKSELKTKKENPILNGVNSDSLFLIKSFYSNYLGKCSSKQIIAFIGAKTSMRPDRRYQWAHESSLHKALSSYIEKRVYILRDNKLKYFGVSMHFTQADRQGLATVPTHTIADVNSEPEKAIDDLFIINSGQDLNSFCEAMQLYLG